MVYGDFKDLPKRTAFDKVLRDKAIDIAKNHKRDGYQKDLASMVCKLFDEKASGSAVENGIMSNQELAGKLRKPFLRKFEIRIIYSSFKDNICGADLANMLLMSRFDKGFRFLVCVIDICIIKMRRLFL